MSIKITKKKKGSVAGASKSRKGPGANKNRRRSGKKAGVDLNDGSRSFVAAVNAGGGHGGRPPGGGHGGRPPGGGHRT